jgi:Coenzyme PQQ synthesis protein D (PqqD)
VLTRTRYLRLRTEDLHWRTVDGEIIALDARALTYLTANSAGAVLWRALSAGATREGLADALVAAYGIARDRALADVDAYVGELAAQGLLET